MIRLVLVWFRVKRKANAKMIFPYAYAIDDLSNQLRLITVPTDFPNLVALYIVVQTGSRNEIEPGKSGFAHLFAERLCLSDGVPNPNAAPPPLQAETRGRAAKPEKGRHWKSGAFPHTERQSRNNRPRKVLNFRTPNEVFNNHFVALIT